MTYRGFKVWFTEQKGWCASGSLCEEPFEGFLTWEELMEEIDHFIGS